jgi:trimeric autotransporter adhesin
MGAVIGRPQSQDNSTVGTLIFQTRSSGAPTEKMRISSSGNVGIGTTSPGATLDVNVTGNNTALKLTRDAGANGVFDIDFDGANTNFNSLYAYTFQTGNTERMRITSGGNVGIGTTSPTYKLQLSTNSAAKPTSNVWTVVSDSRVKENIRTYDSGLDKVLQIEPKLFDYNGKAGFEKTKDNVGIIAQEIKKILPETVNTYKAKLNEGDEEETELYSYDGHALTFALVNSIKELNKKIEQLETKIQTLENKQL